MLKLIELLKLNQPSTWRGLIGLLSGLGVAISPELAEHIVALAVSAFGIVEIVRSEKKYQQMKSQLTVITQYMNVRLSLAIMGGSFFV